MVQSLTHWPSIAVIKVSVLTLGRIALLTDLAGPVG
jgi:hypothetical protein